MTPKKLKFQSPSGMPDIFGKKIDYFNNLSSFVREIARFYG